MGKYSVLFLIFQLLKITQVDTFTKPCNASLLTVSIVTRCPTDEASYNISARQKNCSSLVDSSSCDSFEYHCVLSEDLNSVIEVCAPSIFIIGHTCAMFSITLQSIMRIDNMICGNKREGCPYSYNSTTSYKYRHCIPTEKEIYTTEATQRTSKSITKGEIKEQSDDMNSVIIIIVVVILVIGGTVTVLVFIHCVRHSRRRRQDLLQAMELKDIIVPQTNPVNQHVPQSRGENELQDNDIELDNPEAQPMLDATDEPGLESLPIMEETIADRVDVAPEDGDDSNRHQAMAKIDVDTTEKNKRVMLKCSMNFLTKSLINPDETWTKDKILQHVKGMINYLEDAKETDLLIEFIRTIDQDPNIQTTLIKCGVEMFELISSVQQRYNATKVQIINGCVCFVFSFADDTSMEKLLSDFSKREEHFKNCISKILLNKAFLGIFQIHPETVTWKTCELKVYKGAEEVEDIKPEKPVVGTLKDMFEDKQGAEEVEVKKPERPTVGTIKDILEAEEGAEEVEVKKTERSIVGTIKDILEEQRKEEKMDSILDAFSSTSNTYPAYKNFKTREKSFDGCYNSLKERAGELAKDGFYYEGYDRATSCFHCGYSKNDWTDSDDIHTKHLQLNKKCEFLNYVQSTILKT